MDLSFSLYVNCFYRYTEKVPSCDLALLPSEDDSKKVDIPISSPGPKTDGDASMSKKSDGDSTLSKASDTTSDSEATLEGGDSNGNDITCDDNHFLAQLMTVFWSLHGAKPTNPFLTPVCQPGKFLGIHKEELEEFQAGNLSSFTCW